MKILVTGGAGFIASHVVDRYIELGHEVIVVDNLSGGFEKNLNPKATFHNLDIVSEQFEKLILDEKPEIINHHAAQASVSVSVKKPVLDATVNVLGTVNLIRAAIAAGTRKIIYANTGGALFGEPETLPVVEDSPIHPESPYGVSKYAAERYLHAFSKLENIKYTSLRYSNVYGPRQNPHGEAGVVAIFAGIIKKGEQPTIFGDGSKTRDYVYVSDVVKANELSLEKGDNDYFLIGSGNQISDMQVFNSVRNALNSDIEPIMGDHRKGDIMHMEFNTSKAKEILGWEAVTNFDDGIKQTVYSI
jgi:UDP-glucose 4-epimerase